MSDTDLASKKKLGDLKVKDLRQQLEKRNLDRTGNKTALVERLTKALQSEGCDPEEFLFDVASETIKTPVKSPVVKRPSRKSKDNGVDSVQDEGDAEDEDEEEKQVEQENKKELNKDQDIQDQKQDVNTLSNPGGQKVLQCNGDKEESSQVSSQLAPEKSQLATTTPPVAVQDATKVDERSSENASDSVTVNDAEDASVAVGDKQNAESECQPVKEVKTSDNSIKNESEVLPKMSNDSKEVEVSDSLAEHDVEKTKTVIHTDVKDAPSERTDRESTETSTAATDEKSNKSPETSSQNTVEKKVEETDGSTKLWVSGLNSETRAADLKTLFAKYGKVINAKIVTNAKSPSSRFGFIVMATSECASASIENLHDMEFQGGVLCVEKTTREFQTNGTAKQFADSPDINSKSCSQQSKDDTGDENIKKVDGDSSKAERTKKKEKEAESGKAEVKGEKRKSGGEERKSRKVSSRDRISHSRIESRGWRESRARAYGRAPQRGRFYRASGYGQRGYGRSYNDYRERDVRRSYPSRSRYSNSLSTEELRLENEKQMLRLEKEKIEIERLKLEKEKHRFEREQLELEKAELRARKLSQSLPEPRALKRPFDGHRGKGEGRHWSDRKRDDSLSGSHSPRRYSEYSRERLDYHDKRSDSYEGRPRGEIRPHLSGPSRHEGRHEVESRMFARGRHEEPDEKRPREDWKGSKGRGNFEHSSSSRGFPGRHSIESPSPWSHPAEHELKFGSASVTPPGQWGPVKSDNWSRIDGPPHKRWAGVDARGQPPIGHPANQGMFGVSGSVMMNNIPGNFPLDQFNMNNVIGRF